MSLYLVYVAFGPIEGLYTFQYLRVLTFDKRQSLKCTNWHRKSTKYSVIVFPCEKHVQVNQILRQMGGNGSQLSRPMLVKVNYFHFSDCSYNFYETGAIVCGRRHLPLGGFVPSYTSFILKLNDGSYSDMVALVGTFTQNYFKEYKKICKGITR